MTSMDETMDAVKAWGDLADSRRREEHDKYIMAGLSQPSVRTFDSGATRSSDYGKFDYEGFLSPLVLERYAQYMHNHRVQPDGNYRASDNWQKGLPMDSIMKSAWRHFVAWWKHHRGYHEEEPLEESLCALIFNASAYLHELRKKDSHNG